MDWGRRALSPWPVVAVALAVRLAYFAQYAGTPFYYVPMWDADEYHTIAVELSHGRLHPYLPYRPPFYPFLLGVVYIMFGVGPLAPSLVQIAGGALSCVLVQKIAGRLFGGPAGFGAGMAAALSGMMFYFDLELLPTSLEVLLLLLLLWELLQVVDNKGEGWRAGLWFALGALTRPVLLPLFPFLGWWLWRRTGSTGVRPIASFAVVALGPVVLSLLMHIGAGVGPVAVAAQGGINFYIGNKRGADGMTATFPGVGAGWGWETMRRTAEAEVGRSLTAAEADDYYWKKGRAEIAADPLGWLMLTARKALLFWNHLEISNNRDLYYQGHRYPLFGALMGIGLLAALPPALAGVWLRRPSTGVQLLALAIVVYCAAVVPFFVNARFRHPLTPLFFILAAGGVVGLAQVVKQWKRTASAAKWGSGAALAVGLVLPWLTDADIDPRRWDYGLFTEGTAFERLGRLEEAENFYRRALEVNPRAPFVNFNLGELARRRGASADAADYYRRELDIQPTYGKAWNNLGLLLLAEGQSDRALDCFERAIRLRPDLTEARINAADLHWRRGMAALKSGDATLAEASLARAARLCPDDPRYRRERGDQSGSAPGH